MHAPSRFLVAVGLSAFAALAPFSSFAGEAAPAKATGETAGAKPAHDPKAVLLSLVQAENSFAETASSKGTRAAFLKYLSTNATFYSGLGPVNAHNFWAERPNRQGTLKWEPVFAEATGEGDLGITTGPWSFVPKDGSEPTAWGEFVSVWAREPDGSWKVVVDSGVTHGRPEGQAPLRMRKPAFDVQPRNTKASVDEARSSLAASDDVYLRSVAAWKKRTPAELVMTENVRLLREGKAPVTGVEDVKASLISATAPISCSRESVMVSKGAEIGFTMGTCSVPGPAPAKPAKGAAAKSAKAGQSKGKPFSANAPTDKISYVRIWRWWGWANSAAKRWELVIDLALPFAPPPEAAADIEPAQRVSTQKPG